MQSDWKRIVARLLLVVAVVLLARRSAQAAAEESTEELAKKTQNPVADLISVPFQNNFNFNAGPNERTVYVLNVQPVIPIHLTRHWNLITRIITPIVNVPELAPGVGSASVPSGTSSGRSPVGATAT